MMNLIEIILAAVIAYLFGSLSSAILVCKFMGLPDPRLQGSRNPGATNVLRLGGKKAAAITLLGDVLKGTIPVLLAKWAGLDALSIAIVALAAFMGHLFPIYFRFVGGKGVATVLGCLLALSWQTSLCWMGSWLVMAVLFRYSSLASLTASLLAPFYIWYFTGNFIYAITLGLMALMMLYRHRTNIQKLISGTESKIGKKKS